MLTPLPHLPHLPQVGKSLDHNQAFFKNVKKSGKIDCSFHAKNEQNKQKTSQIFEYIFSPPNLLAGMSSILVKSGENLRA